MTEVLANILAEVTSNEVDNFTWDEWKQICDTNGLRITRDGTELPGTELLNAIEVRTLVEVECECEACEVVEIIEADLNDLKPDGDLAKLLKPPVPVFENRGPTVVSAPESKPKQLSVKEWRENFAAFTQQIPIEHQVETLDGSPLRININIHPGMPPYMFTIISPSVRVGDLRWVGLRENDRESSVRGWEVVILPRSRNEAMLNFDLARLYGLVKKIRIVRVSKSGNVLLAEIMEWL